MRRNFKYEIVLNFGVGEYNIYTNFALRDREKYRTYYINTFKRKGAVKSPSDWLYNQQCECVSFAVIAKKLGISTEVAIKTYQNAIKKLKVIVKEKNISLKDFSI